MEPAVEPFRRLTEHVEVRVPRVPVLSCVTAAPFQDVREQLVQAIVSPVRWTDVMSALHDLGATRYVETGPGRVLTNLVRKSLDDVEADAPLAMEAANA
jgi:malonyl CoA-acyl carrier protein transacylase